MGKYAEGCWYVVSCSSITLDLTLIQVTLSGFVLFIIILMEVQPIPRRQSPSHSHSREDVIDERTEPMS